MACLKTDPGRKDTCSFRTKEKVFERGKLQFKRKDLSLKEDLQEKRTLICCGAVSKDALSNYDVSWLEVQSTCIDFNGRKITQYYSNVPPFSLAMFCKFKTTDI